jgi:hypothetical protein
MKKLLILAFLGGISFFIYKQVFAVSDAYRAYVDFADAMAYDKWKEAKDLAVGESVLDTIDEEERLPKRVGYERWKLLRGVVHMKPYRHVDLEKTSPNGKTVTLRVTQELRRGSVTMAPIGPPTVRHKQEVVMVLTDDGWRVKEFEEEVEPIGKDSPSREE